MGRWMVVVWIAVGSACAVEDDPAPGGATDTSMAASAGTTGTPGLECEDLSSEADCNEMVSQNNLPCLWGTFTAVHREGNVCTELPSVSLCVEMSGWTTEAGCMGSEECPGLAGVALYRQLPDGTMLISGQCGGSTPGGFDACETVLPDAHPPECACACPTFPNYGDPSSGGGNSSSG